jgi:hypothetical protein
LLQPIRRPHALVGHDPILTLLAKRPVVLVFASPPARIASVTSSDLFAALTAGSTSQQILELITSPECGIDIHQLRYNTLDAVDETTTASGALMVPAGSDPACQGPRPIVVYAHGTAAERAYNIAALYSGHPAGESRAGFCTWIRTRSSDHERIPAGPDATLKAGFAAAKEALAASAVAEGATDGGAAAVQEALPQHAGIAILPGRRPFFLRWTVDSSRTRARTTDCPFDRSQSKNSNHSIRYIY